MKKCTPKAGMLFKSIFYYPCLFFTVLLLPYSAVSQANCWLETQGTQIVNAASGQPVILRAVGLGNWGLQEGYMLNPQGSNIGTQWQMKKLYYDQGQSEAQVEAFYQSWRDNFITKADIDYIASLGFNSVRLPMHYELFLTTSQRSVRNSVIHNIGNHDNYKNSLASWYNSNQLFNDPNLEGFKMIDNLISWCASNGMYVILDLHAAPGGQGSDKNIADIFYDNNLWEFPVFQNVTNRLWERISQRYKNEPRIAFYDLINEPNNVPGGGQAIHSLLERLINTIRAQGDNHMLMVEGNGWGNNYDYLEPYTFSQNWGLVYNAHRYWIDPNDDWVRDSNPNQINRMINLIEFRDRHQVPVWIGETGENNNDWLRQNIVKLDQEGIGWCHWTYKRHDVGENAALMRIGGNYPTDGASVMATVLESIKFQNCIANNNTIAAVTQDLPAPWTSGCYPGTTPPPSGSVPVGQTIWLRGTNNQYVSSENGTTAMMCNRATVGGWEQFTVVDAGGGKIALRGSNGQYVSSENGELGMRCNRPSIGGWETFSWVDLGGGQIALQGSNGQYVSSEDGQSAMMCNRPSISGWEAFTWGSTNSIASVPNDSFTDIKAREMVDGNLSTTAFNIFPNPAEGAFTIQVPSSSSINVFDMNGQNIFTEEITKSAKLDNLPAGIYMIVMQNNYKTETKKLIVK